MMNSNMGCIDTYNSDTDIHPVQVMNNNMRCINADKIQTEDILRNC